MEKRIFSSDGEPAPNTEGVYGYNWDYTYLPSEYSVTLTYLNANGEVTYTKETIAGKRTLRVLNNGAETRTTVVTLDHEGKPIPTTDSNNTTYTSKQIDYDDFGNIKEMRNYISEGQLVSDGSPIFKQVWEKKEGIPTRIKSKSWHNADGSLNTTGLARHDYAYDNTGRKKSVSYFGVDGLPKAGSTGVIKAQYEYDEYNRNIRTFFFGLDNELLQNGVIAIIENKFDDYGRVIEKYFRSADRNLTKASWGGVGYKNFYDGYGRIQKQLYLGESGEVAALESGEAGSKAEFDNYGNRVLLVYIDPEGNPVLKGDGQTFGYKAEYDNQHNQIKYTHIGADLTPQNVPAGYAGFTAEFNNLSQETRRTYFDENGITILVKLNVDDEPIECDCGFATILKTYDRKGNLTSQFYYGLDDNLVLSGEGISGSKTEFDGRGNEISIEYFGLDGQLSNARFNVARIEIDYDEYDRIIERRFYDKDKNPVLSAGSTRTIVRKKYDDFGREIHEASFGLDGELVNRSDEGWAVKKTQYDDEFSKTITYEDKDGNSITVLPKE